MEEETRNRLIEGNNSTIRMIVGDPNDKRPRNMTPKQIISGYMSSIAKIGHKKSPRGKEFYKRMSDLGVMARKEKRKLKE